MAASNSMVHRVEIKDTQITNELVSGGDRSFGHSFKVYIEVTDISGCRLRWFEKASKSYYPSVTTMIGGRTVVTTKGMDDNVWTDMHALVPDSPIFKPWRDAETLGGRQTVIIEDIPGILLGQTQERVIEFCIEVIGGGVEKRVTFRQDLWVNPTTGTPVAKFNIWMNNTTMPQR